MLGVLALLLGNLFIVGINQIYDVEIDQINKPFLPVAAGRISPKMAWALVLGSGAAGLAVVKAVFSPLIFWLYLFGTTVGGLYSVPPFQLKRFPLAAGLTIATCRGFLLNFGASLPVEALPSGGWTHHRHLPRLPPQLRCLLCHARGAGAELPVEPRGELPRTLHDGLRLRHRGHQGPARHRRRQGGGHPDLRPHLWRQEGGGGGRPRARTQLCRRRCHGAARRARHLPQAAHGGRARARRRLAVALPPEARRRLALEHPGVLQADLEPLLLRVHALPLHLMREVPPKRSGTPPAPPPARHSPTHRSAVRCGGARGLLPTTRACPASLAFAPDALQPPGNLYMKDQCTSWSRVPLRLAGFP